MCCRVGGVHEDDLEVLLLGVFQLDMVHHVRNENQYEELDLRSTPVSTNSLSRVLFLSSATRVSAAFIRSLE